jgi:hypothetical protein
VDAAILRGRIFPQLASAFEAILSAVGFILGDVVDHDHFPAPLDFVANGGFDLQFVSGLKAELYFIPYTASIHRSLVTRATAHSRRAANDLKNRWHRLDTVNSGNII